MYMNRLVHQQYGYPKPIIIIYQRNNNPLPNFFPNILFEVWNLFLEYISFYFNSATRIDPYDDRLPLPLRRGAKGIS
jgi:hypothetical protein